MTFNNIIKNFKKILIICVFFFIVNISLVQAAAVVVDTCSTNHPGYQCTDTSQMDTSQKSNCIIRECLSQPAKILCCKPKVAEATKDTCTTEFSDHKCMKEKPGYDCIPNKCLTQADNIECCKKNDAGMGFLPTDKDKYETGDYTLNDMISMIIIISKWILSIVGSLALLMFIYGGVIFLISAGNTEQVKKGQQIILGSIIGLIIVFTSYTIINLVFASLGITGIWSISGSWF